uniref:Uncharacterized protein n=1 Tax=Neolamprologus brichardi TaxID=32507 RepID=A0A3Q4GGU7_NEOBR
VKDPRVRVMGPAAAHDTKKHYQDLCKRQQCTIERRGFRQELDSWRHKLIHCVGFESILEGLFGPGLVKDITLFQVRRHTHIYTLSPK